MPLSMTGFATASGAADGWSWVWDLRGVNGRGLDIRTRIPDWLDGVEPAARAQMAAAAARGSITLSLRLTRDPVEGVAALDRGGLRDALETLRAVEAAAAAAGVALRPSSAVDILAMRGVQDGAGAADPAALAEAALRDLPGLIADFSAMRGEEGAALAAAILQRLDEVSGLVGQARLLAEERRDRQAETLRANLARVLDNADGADPDRVAQELALLAVKSDLAEEMDRLDAHVAAARGLLAQEGPVGRKLDFLMQEFNREANTLCSKAQSADLTRVGLDLKTVIDQMREQVQNVE
ncbi:MAG: YicC/YloC family endoribonuclease [Tranquillimonas sp.]|jgi:uncharacterized protein (TIGR00255 family)